jgi:cytidine deaminase
LIEAAREARDHAHCPYSGFAVGAAVLMEDGSIHAGCNVENRTFGLTICAERTALAGAVSKGLREPRAVAVITDTDPPAAPCGACREAMLEWVRDLPILLTNPRGDRRVVQLAELHLLPFDLPGADSAGG